MPVPAPGEEPENQVEAEEEGRVQPLLLRCRRCLQCLSQHPEKSLRIRWRARKKAECQPLLLRCRRVPAMPVPAAGEEPENQVEGEEEGRVPAPPAEVPEVPAMPVAAPEERVPAPRGPNVSGSRTVLTSKEYGNQFNAHIVPR